MVQVINIHPTRKQILQESLGQTLGQGLSSFLNSYSANKDLERVLEDESLQNAPPSKRLGAIESALRPHGEIGQNLLKNRIGVEEQLYKEKVQEVLSKYNAGKVTPSELAGLPTELQFNIKKHEDNIAAQKSKNDLKTKLTERNDKLISQGIGYIVDNDEEGFNKFVSDPDVPGEVKSKVLNIMNAKDVQNRFDKGSIEKQASQVQKLYSSKKKDLQSVINTVGGEKQKKAIDELQKLDQSMIKDLNSLYDNPENFRKLDIFKEANAPENTVSTPKEVSIPDKLKASFPNAKTGEQKKHKNGKIYIFNGTDWVEKK